MDKPTKPSNLMPRSFGGVKNNFSVSLQSSGYEDGVPAIYGGDNLNYQLDATGKELDYCEKICDFINNIPIGKTIMTDSNNKLVYANHLDFLSRNIGEIVQSTIPLTDAGLHLLDGGKIYETGIYADFYAYMDDLYTADPTANYFCSEADWQTSATTYGVCGKFAFGSDAQGDYVRLPKITGFVEGASGVANLGDLTQAGLPDVICPMYSENGIVNDHMASGGATLENVHWSLSTFNSIYGNSNTVQPQSIKVLYYVVVATSTKTDIEVDIDEIATDLNGKADVDLANVPASKGILTESYVNGSNWYRIYSDGWCEQGGQTPDTASATQTKTATLYPSFIDTNYFAVGTTVDNGTYAGCDTKTTASITFYSVVTSGNLKQGVLWYACGYIR